MKRFFVCLAWLAVAAAPGWVGAQHDMNHMADQSGVSLPLGMAWSRVSSGTSWLPENTPMYALGGSGRGWLWMVHGAAFGQFDKQGTFRGGSQVGLVDWEMGMAARSVAGGVLRVNVMTSLQRFVLGDSGYAQLLQTGGSVNGIRLVNRQHPHASVGELAATYEHSLTSGLALSVYGGPVGEPAIGPVTYMHRPSAWDDPFAPLGHHSQDATDAAQGVATLGIYSRRVKVEASAFNAREPGGDRFGFDYTGARLDSYSGRVSVAASKSVTASAWAGYLYAHDPLEEPMGMQRYGASAVHVARFGERSWSNGLVLGVDVHHHGSRHHDHGDGVARTYNLVQSASLESAFDLTRRVTLFGRAEQVGKSADDLGFVGGDLSQQFTVRSLSLGASYAVVARRYGSISLGARGTLNILPNDLGAAYETRTPAGFVVFLRVRPSAMTR